MGVRLTHFAVDGERVSDVLGLAGTVESAYVIRDALETAARAHPAVCTLLSARQRRWWLGDVVNALRTHSTFFRAYDVASVERSLATILRGYDCGPVLPAPAASAPFPVTPADDVDFRMSVLTPASFAELREVFATLLDRKKIELPELVHEHAAALCTPVSERHLLVSFIG